MLGSSDSKKKTLGHIHDTERPERLNDHRHVGHCVHARVVVYMYLIFVMTGQIILSKYLRDLHQSGVH